MAVHRLSYCMSKVRSQMKDNLSCVVWYSCHTWPLDLRSGAEECWDTIQNSWCRVGFSENL